MGDFSDKSSEAKRFRIPVLCLLEYIKEAQEISSRQPPKRFRKPITEIGLKFEERSLSTTRTVMDKQEDARAASEHERIRRLMLEGVIDAPNDHRAIVYGDHNKRHGKKKRKKGKRQEVETQVGLQSSSRPSSTKSSLRGRTPDSRSQGKRVNIEEKENEVYSTSNEGKKAY
ncbi:hypothetical protein MAR_032871 [Mya arenaria]|uniref:Uncharacterized protein n=1 Tax=Mya arenaria TaxID=6604 RepID=A0ABY7G9V5_MYAAR|nr:hypothetical protein MAR_032871 [Mya arenaria]